MSTVYPVNWFEIPAIDMERAKTFYEAVFQIEIGSMKGLFRLNRPAKSSKNSKKILMINFV
ncbi:MAG: hypothetical protein JXQ90_06180 [Cyclobacteriaceae bacterium]